MQKGLLSLIITCITFTGLISFCPFAGFSQGFINNGAYIVTSDSANIYINGLTADQGNFVNQAGGQIKNQNNISGGKITLTGNWINNAANTVFASTATDSVVFAGAVAQSIGGSNGTSFYDLAASGATTKTFNTSSTVRRLVTVGTNTTVDANGKLTLLAAANEHASVGPLLNGASVTNNVIVQSYFTGGNAAYRAFRGVSSPINDALVTGDKTYKQLQSKIIITGTDGTLNGFDKGNAASPNAVTIKTYNEAAPLSALQFTNLPNIIQATTPGKGFFVFFRGDRTNYNSAGTYATGSRIVSPYTTPENVTVEYTGPINQGNINVALSYTNNNDSDVFIGSNLVGNPYPAVIDWHAVKSASTLGGVNISPNIYVIKQDGDFEAYNSDSGVGTDGASRYILPGQAFYVKANAASQTLSFTESCKQPYPSSGTVMRFLSASKGDFIQGDSFSNHSSTSNTQHKVIRVYLSNLNKTKETAIVFSGDKSAKYEDNSDALYFSGSPVILCSRSEDNKNLSINFLPEPKQESQIKLYVATSQPGEFNLSFKDLPSLGNMQIFLQDAFLNKTTHVSKGLVYPFEINNSISTTSGPNRFKLIFKPGITLENFSAKKVYGGSEVSWLQKESIPANKSFIVERSVDGANFEVLGSVAKTAEPNIEYKFLDEKPQMGINFYRLRLPESNGTYSYTDVVALNYELNATDPYFIIYPNPATDVLSVTLKQVTQNAVVSIYSLSGVLLKTYSIKNSNREVFNVSDLETGLYVIKIADVEKNEVGTEKFIKN